MMARFIEMATYESDKRIARVERMPQDGEGRHPVEIARVVCTDDELWPILQAKIEDWDASDVPLKPEHPLA